MVKQHFYMEIGEKRSYPNKVIYEQSYDSLVGKARIRLPYTEDNWALVSQNQDIFIMAGTEEIETFFVGTSKEINRERNEILIYALDNGKFFTKPYTGTYTNRRFEEVVRDIGERCNHKVIFDGVPAYILNRRISRSNTIETSIIEKPDGSLIGDSSSTKAGAFHPSCDMCIYSFANVSYITSVEDKCSKCGKSYVLDYSREKDGFICKSCEAEFCGVCGYEKVGNPVYRLKIVFGPRKGTKFGKGVIRSSSNSTCEEELRNICSANNQYVYITQKGELVVRSMDGFPYPDYTIEPENIREEDYAYKANILEKLKGVTIEYKNGIVRSDIEGLTDNDNKERIKIARKDLGQEEAKKLANNLLAEQMQSLDSDMEITTPLDHGYIPGKWISVPFFVYNYPFFTVTTYHVLKSGQLLSTLKLRLFPSLIGSPEFSANISAGTLNKGDVISTASKFTYSKLCSEWNCIRQKKSGDTFAMSDYLYVMLSKCGIKVRIMEYDRTLLNIKERFVQLDEGNGWKDLDYLAYGFDPSFIPKPGTNYKVVSTKTKIKDFVSHDYLKVAVNNDYVDRAPLINQKEGSYPWHGTEWYDLHGW